MTKKKEKAVVNKKTVKLPNDNELTPYEAMDLADEGQIINELEGKLTAEDMETFVYSFPDKSTGRNVTGLSWKGTKATWWELNSKKLTNMTITDKMKITQGDGYVDVAVYAYDKLRDIGTWGMARGYTSMKTRGGSIVDRFASAKAMSKAQRNALNHLFPSELVAKIIQKWIKKGNVKQLTPNAVSQVQSNVVRSSGARTSYPTQVELMKKYGMQDGQVSPKCPSCGSEMRIMERKDKTGIFWSCPNWRSKGCKGYNIDDIDIDGTITMKKNQKGKVPNTQEMAEVKKTMPF